MDIEANTHEDPGERKRAARPTRRSLKASTVRNEMLRSLPPGYYLSRSGPDILFLHRPDGRFVAAFSVREEAREGVEETARE
jgi:hypothetical protein